MNSVPISPGSYVGPALTWLNVNHHDFFAAISDFFSLLISGLVWLFNLGPPPVMAAAFAAVALVISGWRLSVLTAAGLGVCIVLGMWTETMETLALVTLAVLFSVVFGVAIGIVVSRRKALEAAIRPVLDVMQTLPPWVYLVPAVILFGLGTVPALLSTIVFGIAPMVRLTVLALQQVPAERRELGESIGSRPSQMLMKIELPSALPTLLVGVNQTILLSLAMVVLAGLVGAGGLGSEVTRGLSRLDFGLGLRASFAIVMLAIILDRVFRGAVPAKFTTVT